VANDCNPLAALFCPNDAELAAVEELPNPMENAFGPELVVEFPSATALSALAFVSFPPANEFIPEAIEFSPKVNELFPL
jgi:hypothetical protein